MHGFFWQEGGPADQCRGISIASAAEHNVTLAILGELDAEPHARELLQAYVRGEPPELIRTPAVGYVVVDAGRLRTQVVAAPVAQRQIFWSTRGGCLRVASAPSLLVPPGSGEPELTPDAIFSYVYFHYVPGPLGAFSDTSKLSSGHILEWDTRTTRTTRYWKPSFTAEKQIDEGQAIAELHRLLANAVGSSMGRGGRCGAFLSGGLDSSTVAGFAAKRHPGISTVSIGFDADGYDEIGFARTASRHFGTRALEYYVTPDDVLRSLPDIAAAFSEPFGNSSAAAAFHCARIAREEGLDTLLAGDGGDEFFGGNERYATQLTFERWAAIPAPLRALAEPLIAGAARVTTRFPIGKAQRYVQQAKTPLPDRLQDYNFLHRIPPETVFEPDVLRHADQSAPLRLLREEYGAPRDAGVLDRMLFMDWRYTLHDNDLVKVNTMCDLAGVRVEYPMLDPALIQFSMRLPSDWKVRNGQLRWFYKKAMRGFLPDQIIDKTKHGFGLPFGVWTRTHAGLQRLVEDSLQSLSQRRYFRSDFISKAQRLHREGHAAYYGELVWILMVLELWLQRHMPKARL